MRSTLLAPVLGLVACGDIDRIPPVLLDAVALPDTTLGVTNPVGAFHTLVETTSLPTIALLFSEPLDGDAVQEVLTDPYTGTTTELVGRDGVVRIAPADGSVVAESIAYHPENCAIRVVPETHLPAGTVVLFHLMAERVWDPAGNIMPAARFAGGEPLRDVDGRSIAATVALITEPISLLAVNTPAFGTIDDPTTNADETVPYDAAVALDFNTAMMPTTVVASFSQLDGEIIAGTPGTGNSVTQVCLTPAVPLAPASTYELRIEAGTDHYGIDWNEPPRLLTFSTL